MGKLNGKISFLEIISEEKELLKVKKNIKKYNVFL